MLWWYAMMLKQVMLLAFKIVKFKNKKTTQSADKMLFMKTAWSFLWPKIKMSQKHTTDCELL